MQRQTHPLPHTTHTRGRNTIIFFHAIPHKQNNHLRAIPHKRNQPSTHNPAQTKSTIYTQSRTNETVGAVPACPPERPRSGVSIPKIHALCAGDERRMRPCRATRAGTQAPPLPISIIFFHTIPYKQNNHLRAIPHKRNQPSTHNPAQTKSTIYTQSRTNETVGAVPACPPERPRSGVSIPKTHALCAGDERRMRP